MLEKLCKTHIVLSLLFISHFYVLRLLLVFFFCLSDLSSCWCGQLRLAVHRVPGATWKCCQRCVSVNPLPLGPVSQAASLLLSCNKDSRRAKPSYVWMLTLFLFVSYDKSPKLHRRDSGEGGGAARWRALRHLLDFWHY